MASHPINNADVQQGLEKFFALLSDLNNLALSECIEPVYVVGQAEGESETDVLLATINVSEDDDLSGEVDLGARRLVALEMPDSWTAADITFKVARESGGTFRDLYDDAGSQVTLTVDADRVVGISDAAGALAACRFIKIATSVAQGADREIRLIVKA